MKIKLTIIISKFKTIVISKFKTTFITSSVRNVILLGALCLSMVAVTANAQTYQGEQGRQQDYITIFEHCDYRGDRRTLSVGDYSNMSSIDFGNDQVSSIRVPAGFTVTIFEDDDFRGDSARIIRDIKCFDKKWNDRVSSLSVDSDNRRSYQSQPDYSSDGRFEPGKANVTGRNVARVAFGNQLLQQIDPSQWRMSGGRTDSVQLQEVSRDDNAVLLQNDFTAQRVRIDLFANDVTVINRGGQPQRFGITSAQPALQNSAPKGRAAKPRIINKTVSPSRLIKGPCFRYKAYTRGGGAGIRFHGHDGFNQFRNKGFSGRICDTGTVVMEINKTNLNTDVLVEIQGRTYRFAPNEKADAFRNTWYRKIVKLVVKK